MRCLPIGLKFRATFAQPLFGHRLPSLPSGYYYRILHGFQWGFAKGFGFALLQKDRISAKKCSDKVRNCWEPLVKAENCWTSKMLTQFGHRPGRQNTAQPTLRSEINQLCISQQFLVLADIDLAVPNCKECLLFLSNETGSALARPHNSPSTSIVSHLMLMGKHSQASSG